MTMRTRKLIGTILLLVLVTVYCLLVMVLAVTVVPQIGKTWEAVFYAIAGLAWVPPAGLLISWMHKPDPAPAGSDPQ
jgi:hypothetical protein